MLSRTPGIAPAWFPDSYLVYCSKYHNTTTGLVNSLNELICFHSGTADRLNNIISKNIQSDIRKSVKSTSGNPQDSCYHHPVSSNLIVVRKFSCSPWKCTKTNEVYGLILSNCTHSLITSLDLRITSLGKLDII